MRAGTGHEDRMATARRRQQTAGEVQHRKTGNTTVCVEGELSYVSLSYSRKRMIVDIEVCSGLQFTSSSLQ